MRLYLVLLPFFFLSQNNLWSWQSSSTMTKQEIEAQLALKNQALEALLKKYNLSIKTALTAEQLAILKKAHAILGIAEAPQDIGKKTFIEYVQEWVQDFIKILDEEKRTDLQINVPNIITSLREQIKKPNFPISMLLWKTLKTEINKLSSPTTAEGLRGALLKGFHAFKTEIGTKFQLTQHFKKNRASYQKIKKKNLNELVMTASNFETWLKGLLKEQRELEKEQREALEKQEEKQEKFNNTLERWEEETRNSIELLFTDSIKYHIVDKSEFLAKLKSKFTNKYSATYPNLTQIIEQSLVDAIKGESLLVVEEIGSAFSNAVDQAAIYIRNNKAAIRKIYKQHALLPSFKVIQNIILESKTEIAANDLNLFYWEWKKSISSTIEQVAMDKNWSTGQLLKTSKLVNNFKAAFANEAEIHSAFLSKVFREQFEAVGKKLMTYQEFASLWPKALAGLNSAIARHTEEVLSKLSGEEIKTLIGSLDLPDANRLANAIFDSRYYRPRIKATKGDTIGVQFTFDDATQLLVNLAPTTKTIQQGVGITLDNLSSLVQANGNHGYTFQVDSLQQSDPHYDASSKQTITKFSFNIQADKSRGSSSKGTGTVTGGSTATEIGYTYTRGKEDATITGKNTARTTGDNTETTKQKDVIHTDNTTNRTGEETYKEDSDSYGVDVGINTPIGGIGGSYNKTYTQGKANSKETTKVDETITTTTNKTVTNKIDTKTVEDVDLTEEKTLRSHAFSISRAGTTYDQNTTNDATNTDHGISSGGTQVTMELHSNYDATKKTVTVTFKNIALTSLELDKIKLKELKTTPSPLVISVK